MKVEHVICMWVNAFSIKSPLKPPSPGGRVGAQ